MTSGNISGNKIDDNLLVTKKVRIGAGNLPPESDLHISAPTDQPKGEIRLEEASGRVITLTVDATNGAAISTNGAFPLDLQTQRTSSVFINENGNVGIGKTDPLSAKLTVAGSLKVDSLQLTTDTVVTEFSSDPALSKGLALPTAAAVKTYIGTQISNINTSPWTKSENGGSIYYNPNNTSGYVGIGTNNPSAKLEVAGNLKLNDGVPVNKFSDDDKLNGNTPSSSTVPTERAVKAYVDSKLTSITTSQWTSGNGGTIYYNGNGNVGIGTDKPSAKLEVAGNFQLERGVPVNEFVSDLSTFNGNPSTSVPTLALLEKAIGDLKKQFQQELEAVKQELTSAKQEIESLQNNIQSLSSDLEKAKADLDAAKRPTAFRGVVLVNNRNEFLALRTGNYNVGDLIDSGFGNDNAKAIVVFPEINAILWTDKDFSGERFDLRGDGFYPNSGIILGDHTILDKLSSIQVNS